MTSAAYNICDVSEAAKREALDALVAERLGGGIARDVFVLRHNRELVIKIEQQRESFNNIIEFKVWEELQNSPWREWFAPCVRISACGIALIQERTRPFEPAALPKRVPNFIQDLHLENFGMLEGRVVCHDYGFLQRALRMGWNRARLRTVEKGEWGKTTSG